jgi:hypothetical protein
MALSTIAQLNLLTAIDRFLPRMGPKTARTVAAAYALSATAAVLASHSSWWCRTSFPACAASGRAFPSRRSSFS